MTLLNHHERLSLVGTNEGKLFLMPSKGLFGPGVEELTDVSTICKGPLTVVLATNIVRLAIPEHLPLRWQERTGKDDMALVTIKTHDVTLHRVGYKVHPYVVEVTVGFDPVNETWFRHSQEVALATH